MLAISKIHKVSGRQFYKSPCWKGEKLWARAKAVSRGLLVNNSVLNMAWVWTDRLKWGYIGQPCQFLKGREGFQKEPLTSESHQQPLHDSEAVGFQSTKSEDRRGTRCSPIARREVTATSITRWTSTRSSPGIMSFPSEDFIRLDLQVIFGSPGLNFGIFFRDLFAYIITESTNKYVSFAYFIMRCSCCHGRLSRTRGQCRDTGAVLIIHRRCRNS